MKIYLIEKRDEIKPYLSELEKYGEVIILGSGEKDILKYFQLFEDREEKVIGVNTGIIEWKFPKEALEKITNLKGIASKSTWINYLDLDYCVKKGIKVSKLTGTNSQSVAEYAIWIMLSLAKKLPMQIHNNFKTILESDAEQTEIAGKTMGILGLGQIGNRIAKMGRGLGMKVMYWSRKSRDEKYEYKDLDEVLRTSDFIFNCVQTLEETRGFLNREKLSLLKKEAYVISVIGGMGWGPQDDTYLVKMVKTGKLAGYGVENEDEPNFEKPEILPVNNIFIPANYAYYTREARHKSREMWIENIIGLASGKPINMVN